MTTQRRADQLPSDIRPTSTAEDMPGKAQPSAIVHQKEPRSEQPRTLLEQQQRLARQTETKLPGAPAASGCPFERQRNLTNKQAAEFLSVHPHTLDNWRWSGKGPIFEKMGRRVSYCIQDLLDFKERCRRKSTSDQVDRHA